MYNRYIRNDNGTYAPIPEEEGREGGTQDRRQPASGQEPPPPPPREETNRRGDSLTGLLRSFLDRLHLEKVDTGDLLILLLLFLLFEEDADEELLFALGLLLIL